MRIKYFDGPKFYIFLVLEGQREGEVEIFNFFYIILKPKKKRRNPGLPPRGSEANEPKYLLKWPINWRLNMNGWRTGNKMIVRVLVLFGVFALISCDGLERKIANGHSVDVAKREVPVRLYPKFYDLPDPRIAWKGNSNLVNGFFPIPQRKGGMDRNVVENRVTANDHGILVDQKNGKIFEKSTYEKKVFPGAVGFGSNTIAGRGGQIIKVTNLNDHGPGSLRAAINASGPRIVVFEVGGGIVLENDLEIENPFITIAGQTAPSPGIQIRGGRLTIQTNDVLVQHIRVRNGKNDNQSHSLRIISGAYNVVVDHCTFMWASDEIASVWTNEKPIHDVTISNNIIANGLGDYGTGMAIGSGTQNDNYFLGKNYVNRISVVRNLFANVKERAPMVSRESSVVIVNNLGYNTEWGFVEIGVNDGPVSATIIGNNFIDGDVSKKIPLMWAKKITNGKHSIYLYDNIAGSNGMNVSSLMDYNGGSIVENPPLEDDTQSIPGAVLIDYILKNVGARPVDRDSLELELMNQIRNREGGYDYSIHAFGGWPTSYNESKYRFLFLPLDPHSDKNDNGYSDIEDMLFDASIMVESEQ